MEMNVLVDRGKLGAERLVETMPGKPPPMERFGIRAQVSGRAPARGDRGAPVGRVALAAAALSVFAGLAYVARARLFAADEVEVGEDVAEAARKAES